MNSETQEASLPDVSDPVGKDIAAAASGILTQKAMNPLRPMFVLAVLAGAFIAFGSVISVVAQANMGSTGGVSLLAGASFSVGLILVMIVGAELFTGNTLQILPAVTGDLATGRLAAAWTVVWVGNLIGSMVIAVLFAAAGGMADGVGEAAISLRESKLAKSSFELFCSAILANMLVCLAVWMAMDAKTLPAKVLAIVGPVTVFVAAGLEHSVANMSLLPLGWLAEANATVNWSASIANLALTTLGNTVGGGVIALSIAYGHSIFRKG